MIFFHLYNNAKEEPLTVVKQSDVDDFIEDCDSYNLTVALRGLVRNDDRSLRWNGYELNEFLIENQSKFKDDEESGRGLNLSLLKDRQRRSL